MTGRWRIDNHHLVLEINGMLIHPSAKEVYSVLNGGNIRDMSCPNIQELLPRVRFSKFGSEVSVDLKNDTDGRLC